MECTPSPERPVPPTPRQLILSLLASLAVGCGGARTPAGKAADAAPAADVRPLAGLASQRILVAPAYALRRDDSMGWGTAITDQRAWLGDLDGELAFALGERGLRGQWVFAEDLVRGFRRNPTLSPDPYRLTVEPLRTAGRLAPGTRLPEPLASQVRTLVAVHDARFVLIPLETGFEPAADAGGRARLRLALVDARLSDVRWIGEVRGDPHPTLTPAVAASLAARFADLIAAP